MKVHEIIAALAGEDPNANVVIHDQRHGWVHLDGYESPQDASNPSVVPTFDMPEPVKPFDTRFDDSKQGSRSISMGNAIVCVDHSDYVEGCYDCATERRQVEGVAEMVKINRLYNMHYASNTHDDVTQGECECAAMCSFCAITHYPTDHEIDDTDSQVVSSRWHIDDVKMAIADDGDYKDAPMPSDQALYDYLHRQVQNDYFVGEINQSISDELGDLFPEIYAVKMAAWKAEREAAE
tara:strand:- start:534 stop:1244 length:711 start_codon:yes stop_codon:yes gene_type:complete